MVTKNNRFARHPTFLFLLYNVVNRRRAGLGYYLLTKTRLWEQTHTEVDALTMTELNEAANEIKTIGKCTNPAILKLERQVQIVAAQTPHSFARCAEQAIHIKALMISDGMLVLWITLNPSDLQCFLVLILAGVQCEDSRNSNTADAFARATATMNPIVVAQFFETICTGIFEHLLAAGSKDGGLLGPVSTYFGTVETNGRGMLHLHCLVWLRGAFHLSEIRNRLCSDTEYAAKMVEFVDNIIKCSIISTIQPETLLQEAPRASLDETDEEFSQKLEQDSNAIAAKSHLHSSTHNATCFKYGAAASGQCRFNFPRPQLAQTTVSDQGTIDVERNNVWINPWCPALASLTRSNHDINFIPSNVKALALVRYITNYATKGDCSQYQRIMGAAFVRKAYEDATDQRIEDGSTGVVQRARIDKFALRAFNRLAYDREISGPLAANTLLDLPEYFTPKKIIRKINLWALRKRFSRIIFGGSADKDVAEDFILFERSRQLPSSKFDDSNWRGAELAAYSFYDYLKTITVIPNKDIKSGDIFFATNHPNRTFYV